MSETSFTPDTKSSDSQTLCCIACSGRRLHTIGPLPSFYTPDFLGVNLDPSFSPGHMCRCRDCELQFRVPTPTAQKLGRYYALLPKDDLWNYGLQRQVYAEVARLIARAPKRSVLDIGCFRGDLLTYLGAEWQRFGVEPAPEARAEAKRRGIIVLADSVEQLTVGGQRFGAITLVDVIEHLPQPLDVLRKLSQALLPGGLLVIFTGSTDAWSWRVSGLRYWYSALPEHLAFFCPAWFSWAAPHLDTTIHSMARLSHRPADLRIRLDEGVKNAIYIAYHHLAERRKHGRFVTGLPLIRRVGRWTGCWWTSARDHILVALVKQQAAGG